MNVKIFSCPFILSKLSKIFIFRGQLCENCSVFFFPSVLELGSRVTLFLPYMLMIEWLIHQHDFSSSLNVSNTKSKLLIIWIKWIHKLGLCTVYLHSETVSPTNLNYSSYSFKSQVAVIKFVFLYGLCGKDADSK